MKGWVGLVGWVIADSLPMKWSPVQLLSRAQTGKVHRPRLTFYILYHTTDTAIDKKDTICHCKTTLCCKKVRLAQSWISCTVVSLLQWKLACDILMISVIKLPPHLSHVSTLPDITQKRKSYVVFLSVVWVALKRTGFCVSEVAMSQFCAKSQ